MQEKDRLILQEYSRELRFGRSLSPETVRAYSGDLERLSDWCSSPITEVSRDMLRGFLMHETARGLDPHSLSRLVSAIHSFGGWLSETGRAPSDPSTGIRPPGKPARLPGFLSVKEVLTVLDAFDNATPLHARNRAVMEVLYGCGLRASETANLTVSGFDRNELTLRVAGKGGNSGSHRFHRAPRCTSGTGFWNALSFLECASIREAFS